MYTVQFTPAGHRIFKKLPKDVKEEIVAKATILKTDPLQGEQLHGKYHYLRSLHFSYKAVAYRIIYQWIVPKETVVIYLADKRENIYKRLEHMGI
jgi:mRNA-degrading endonuclease RelE of RelBE toxin-antitoxin system